MHGVTLRRAGAAAPATCRTTCPPVACLPAHRAQGAVPSAAANGLPVAQASCSPACGGYRADVKPSNHRRNTRCASSRQPVVAFFNTTPPFAVAKLQVGMFGKIGKLQAKLDTLADRDTEDPDELHDLMTEVVMFILRNKRYCAYAHLAALAVSTPEVAEQRFKKASLVERARVREETLVNVGGRTRMEDMTEEVAAMPGDDWMVITLIIAAEAKLSLPKTISSLSELEDALATLGGIGVDDLLAFELMWTPQAAGDSYTREELSEDFPNLAPI